jgi:hypothetical protein
LFTFLSEAYVLRAGINIALTISPRYIPLTDT